MIFPRSLNSHGSFAGACAAALALFALLPLRGEPAESPLSYARFKALPLAELKASLERAGWPASHVQALLNAEIQQRLNPPFEPQPSDLRPFEFWRTGPDAEAFLPADARRHQADQARREAEASAAFDALFAASPPAESPALAAWNIKREWGELAPAKRAAITATLGRAASARDAIMEPRGGLLSRAEWNRVWQIAAEARGKIENLLTAEELLDHDLRTSATANRMRKELDNFQPTQAEFLAIFRLRHAFDLAFEHKPRGVDAVVDQQRAAAEAEVEKKLAAQLGLERYDDYRLSLQPACQLLQFDGRFAQVDAASIRALYRDLLKTKARLAEIDASTQSDAGKHAAQQQAKTEIYQRFTARLDEEGARRYLQEQGVWP
ncbi:MAG TPA: hypothetical protein VHO24_12600 [Opitutaceae bacterium]|nr:hypothetical protein [Opitutaceae bacterium]